MEDATWDRCCQEAWQELQQAWAAHGNACAFWDTYQALLQRLCEHSDDSPECANQLARMTQRLGAVDSAVLV